MSPLRGILIGCGHISRSHLPGWAASPNAHIVAVCDVDATRAAARAAEFGIAHVYTDPAVALREHRPDFVDIATRPETHGALIALAAEHGAHVLCQKPLAPSLAAARAMAAVCEHAGVRLMVTEMWRWLPWYRLVAERMAEGEIGPVHFLRFSGGRKPFRRTRPINDTQPYFADMPHLMVYEMMIHWIDTARFLLGEVNQVYARLHRVNPAIVGEDVAVVTLAHANGATSLLDHSWGSAPERPEANRRDGNVLVEGANGSYRFDDEPGHLYHVDLAGRETLVARFKDDGDPFLAAFASCLDHFALSLTAGTAFESEIDDNLRTLAVTLAAYESASEGQAVRPTV